MFWPAVTSSWPAWPVETAISCVVRGAAVATSGASWSSSAAISRVEFGDAAGERAQRELGGLGRLVQSDLSLDLRFHPVGWDDVTS